nr:immunoglobulin heavy chain junction region [Mus musculus]
LCNSSGYVGLWYGLL